MSTLTTAFRFPDPQDPSQPCGRCSTCLENERMRAFVVDLRRDVDGVEILGPGRMCRRVVAHRLAQRREDPRP